MTFTATLYCQHCQFQHRFTSDVRFSVLAFDCGKCGKRSASDQPQAGACPQRVELEKSRDGWMYECQQYMEKCRAVLQRPGDKGQIQPTSDSATDKSVLAP